MKKALLPIIFAVIGVIVSSSAVVDKNNKGSKIDRDGHVLVGLWSDYSKAFQADKPQTAEKILDRIIQEAGANGYAWDFYDGLVKWRNIVVSRNWKRRPECLERIASASADFANPVVTCRLIDAGYISRTMDMQWYNDYVVLGRQSLQKARNSAFYGNGGRLPDFMASHIANDYEYILWYLGWSSGRASELARKAAREALSSCLKDSYPGKAYMEFLEIQDAFRYNDIESRKAALEEYRIKYDGKAISLLAVAELLNIRKMELDKAFSEKAGITSEDYRKLRQDCAVFEKSWKSFSGSEAEIAAYCTDVESLVKNLDGRALSIFRDGYSVYVVVRNLDKVSLELRREVKNGKTLHKAELNNSVKSYYIRDTLKYIVPDKFDDGDYFLLGSGGDCERSIFFPLYSMSIACRNDAGGMGVYIADAISGKPVEKADIEVEYKSEQVRVLKDIVFDKFTDIQDIAEQLEEEFSGMVRINCAFTDAAGLRRRTRSIYVDKNRQTVQYVTDYSNGMIFTDRSAFNPGDTVRFKAVLYSVSGGDYRTLPAGKQVKAKLRDPDYKDIAVLHLATNEFGSLEGEYVIPEKSKGGRYCIEIQDGETAYGCSWIHVDEFVLPTYDLEFEKHDDPYFSGEAIVIKGKLRSYSGHALSSARMSYTVRNGRTGENISGKISPGAGGNFEFSFQTPADVNTTHNYYVTVKVVDQTGETQEWNLRCIVEPQIQFGFTLENDAEATLILKKSGGEVDYILDGDVARFSADVYVYDVSGKITVPADVSYMVTRNGETVVLGKVSSGDMVEIDLSGYPSGLYCIEAESEYIRPDGKRIASKDSCRVLKAGCNDTSLDEKVLFFTRKYSGKGIQFQIGCNDGPMWLVAELHDDNARLLRSDLICVGATPDEHVKLIGYDFRKEYPSNVYLQIFGFINGGERVASYEFCRSENESDAFPLEFSRFTDTSCPGAETEFCLKTNPEVECVATVFDISTERIMPNVWTALEKVNNSRLYADIRSYCGGDRNMSFMEEEAIPFSLNAERPSFMAYDMAAASRRLMSKAAAAGVTEDSSDDSGDVAVRENFSNTLAFLPFLRSDKDGKVTLSVKTGDKLSTYWVQVFAHDRNMNTAAVRREMLVTMPLKVSVAEPQFLYEGDIYRLRASVSNGSDSDAEGTLRLYVYDTKDYKDAVPVMTESMPLSVSRGESASGEFEITVPEASVLGFKVVYISKLGEQTISDGLFVTVPVFAPVQHLTEAHSAVLRAGMDRDSLRLALASQFTGTSAEGACYREIKLIDMVLESIPDKIRPSSDNIFALIETYYVGRISALLGGNTAEDSLVLKKILACRNSDGGFGWFDGFNSSVSVTACLLEYMALLKERTGECGIPDEVIESAVKYLDSHVIDSQYPLWFSCLSTGRYLYIRSMYPQVKFAPEAGSKALKKFKKEAGEYLLPSDRKPRGVYDNLYVKFMRASTAFNLSSESAKSLASALGLSQSKLSKSVLADMSSFFEYAVEHSSGGMYYPNAVMPLRGMLETEAYAHSMICDLMDRYSKASSGTVSSRSAAIADGIRLWLMVQKETQKWQESQSYINAVNSALGGSDAVKSAAIAVLSKSYDSPFSDVKSAGNGFSIERKFYRENVSAREEIKEGDILSVGDKIVAEYKVWGEENRSLVVLTAPRYAGLRPVDQLSGIVRGWIRPLSLARGLRLSPCSYREVKSDRTIWYMEVCPEEHSTFKEEFYVTSAGTFTAPVVTIESVYAEEYRANDSYNGRMVSSF